MSEEKPLHVKVAEALGWTDVRFAPNGNLTGFGGTDEPVWIGTRPGSGLVNESLPRYDTDWSATGPLIEQFHIELFYVEEDPQIAEIFGENPSGPFRATHKACASPELGACCSDSYLKAACHLILALSEAEKLPR